MSNQEKNSPIISLIAVLSKKNRAIGAKNTLLWKIEGDLPRFKAITTGHPIIMGRLTYESIGRPLPNRKNIVISRTGNIENQDSLTVVDTIEKAFEEANKEKTDEIFVIGGGKIYKDTIHLANRLYLTLVDDEPEADTYFPDYSEFNKVIKKEEYPEHTPPFTYVILEK